MIKTVLVVEDDSDLRTYLKKILVENDFAVLLAEDGTDALRILQKTPPDLVILDLGLPRVSGESVAMELKKNYPEIPIVILTARGETSDVIHGFNLGVDDYISKPFEAEVLIARIKARLRARGEDGVSMLKVGDLVLDNKTFEVKRGSKAIHLSQTEFELLRYLMSNTGRVLTREMILNKVWLYSPNIESRVVDVYIGYLRKKIDSEFKKKLIQSRRGFGYTIKE